MVQVGASVRLAVEKTVIKDLYIPKKYARRSPGGMEEKRGKKGKKSMKHGDGKQNPLLPKAANFPLTQARRV
jgi:transcriptional accessory protein Tex/SPT6